MMIVAITAIFALILAFVLGSALGFFREFFAVPSDPLVDKIREALPGANCGGCGYPGCDNYASAVASGGAPVNACPVGGSSTAEKLASLMGVTSGSVVQTIAVLACQGSSMHAKPRGNYTGLETCRGAKLTGGTKLCSWGCIGFGDCVKACKFGAISMNEKQMPKVDAKKCTNCKMCVNECPKGILKAVPREQKGAMVLCSNKSPVKGLPAKQCRIACIKCGLCVKNCPEQCVSLNADIPVIDLSKCTSCGTCVEKCPTKVIKIIERDIF